MTAAAFQRFGYAWLRSRAASELEAELEALSAKAQELGAEPHPDADACAELLGQVNAIAAEVDRRKAGGK